VPATFHAWIFLHLDPYKDGQCTYTHYAHCTHTLYTLYSYTMHTVLIHYAHCTHTLCTLYSYTMHTVLIHYAHCTHTLCTLYSYTMHTVLIHYAHQDGQCTASFALWNSVWNDDGGYSCKPHCDFLFKKMTGSTETENILLGSQPVQYNTYATKFLQQVQCYTLTILTILTILTMLTILTILTMLY
jgi:hypothetical protein